MTAKQSDREKLKPGMKINDKSKSGSLSLSSFSITNIKISIHGGNYCHLKSHQTEKAEAAVIEFFGSGRRRSIGTFGAHFWPPKTTTD